MTDVACQVLMWCAALYRLASVVVCVSWLQEQLPSLPPSLPSWEQLSAVRWHIAELSSCFTCHFLSFFPPIGNKINALLISSTKATDKQSALLDAAWPCLEMGLQVRKPEVRSLTFQFNHSIFPNAFMNVQFWDRLINLHQQVTSELLCLATQLNWWMCLRWTTWLWTGRGRWRQTRITKS